MINKIQTGIGLFGNMSKQIQEDDNAIASTLSRTSCADPALRTPGMKLCIFFF